MSSNISVVVTEQTRPTKSNNGLLQIVGVEGGAFPLSSFIWIPNTEQPLKPGRYTASDCFQLKGFDIVVNLQRNNLVPAK
jgi:hypothetical protein